MPHTGLVARVLIDSPLPQLDHLFDYGIPAEMVDLVTPGVRVRVPFRSGGRIVDGYVIEVFDRAVVAAEAQAAARSATTSALAAPEAPFLGALSPLDGVVSTAAVLRPEVYRLARSVADRAAGNASDVIRLGVPPRAVRVEKAWLAARAASAEAQQTDAAVPAAADVLAEPARALVAPFFSGYPTGRLDTGVMNRERLAVAAIPEVITLASGRTVGRWAVTLAELGLATLGTGHSAILCVPDFRDQDQLQAALDDLAPTLVADSGVTRVDARQANPARYKAFLGLLDDRPRIIIGNRSAVYAPAFRLGLIALWDDGDPLYSEPLSPYVHARDAALVRREQADCALVLLSHSRSVEAERLVEIGWLAAVHPAKNRHPRVIPTDFQSEPDPQARAARIPSAAWQAARAALAQGPVLVQVASPGYAPMLACQSCKKAARCTTCQGPLGLASRSAVPACRWCGALAAGWACVHCEATNLRVTSMGTGRTAEELGRAFPGARVIVADGDHTIQELGPEPALVIATRGAEPIPTGGYRAILLLDGERMLARESLRVGEDCLRWWSNAAALAAPGASVLLAGVGGALASALNAWQPEVFAASELSDRRQLRFPPAVRVASVTGTPNDVAAALADLTGQVNAGALPGLDVLGPVPAENEQNQVRAVVRFGYASGAGVAHSLKASVVRNAARRRRPKSGSFVPTPTLKVRFDDPELL
ncbi:primosomal protein N' [Cryobacterium melibiosiphilum]|uniref:Probable replication restart protein PriA n=1 Tax=Cryobacterium melibiosiphilum TaxID=995039 RepID=A0A3A5MKD2_9MICO|nr:primosomal protein N' [Cryobacterium melibiosiphilum]RJT89515.1 primosomal protein N' [Cryobacterium melibiosiphilum]